LKACSAFGAGANLCIILQSNKSSAPASGLHAGAEQSCK
jgi:hypothetical protein